MSLTIKLSLLNFVRVMDGDADKKIVGLITNPLGRITDNDYDAQGRLIAMTYAQGTIDEAKRQITGIDQVLANENSQGQVLWTLTDNQGTVRNEN